MTICIAAICDEAPGPHKSQIVSCTDWRASSILGKTDKALKRIAILPDNWFCLIAGIEAEIKAMIPIMRRLMFESMPVNETNIVTLLRQSVRERKIDKADEFCGGRWGVTFDEFKKGKGSFPEDVYRENLQEIGRIMVGAEFIVAGFDSNRFAMLIEVQGSGEVNIRENFAAIGEGRLLAESVLMHREQQNIDTLASALYKVYEAKKHAERVTSVGESTSIYLDMAGTATKMLNLETLLFLEQEYSKFGPKNLPQGFVIPDGVFGTL